MGIKEHISLSQQFLRPHHIQNGAGIHAAGYRECHSAGHIGLNQTGNDVHTGTLGGNNQVNSRRSRQLCKAADRFFHLTRTNHHQIGKLIHNDDYLRKLFGYFLPLRHALFSHGFYFFIVAFQISYIMLGKFPIPVFHFRHSPMKGSRCLLGIRHNRDQKVGNTIIHTQFHHFGIHHDQLHIFRMRFVQNSHY